MSKKEFPQPNQEVLLTRQRHEAERMGLHYDTRIVVGDKAYSWASKKLTPEPGKSIILFEQPVHDREYALSDMVEIPTGNYGAGKTYLEYAKKAKLNDHASDEQFTVTTTDDGTRLLFRKLPADNPWGDKAWLHRNLGRGNMENKYLDKVAKQLDMFPKELSKEHFKQNGKLGLGLATLTAASAAGMFHLAKNKYKEKIASSIQASNISSDDWKKLDRQPELKDKILNQGVYIGNIKGAPPADGINWTRSNDFLDANNCYSDRMT
jgi:hypothetical protein